MNATTKLIAAGGNGLLALVVWVWPIREKAAMENRCVDFHIEEMKQRLSVESPSEQQWSSYYTVARSECRLPQ